MATFVPSQEEIDRISNLPDPLLHHILSLLPIKHAIATSLVLSKRWGQLGLTMPSLRFIDDCEFPSLNSFVQFVDAVLFLSDSKPLTMFSLTCKRFQVPPFRINLWIKAVVNRKVQHLELNFADFMSYIDVPSCIFNTTIEFLTLSRVIVNARSPVNMPKLKGLHLVKVQISSPESAANILRGCSLLQVLVLTCKYVSEEGSMIVKVPRFEHLLIAILGTCHIPLTAFSKVKYLRVVEDWCLPHIQAIPTFDDLTDLELSCMGTYDVDHIVKCLRRFPKLEVLEIHKLEAIFISDKRLIDSNVPEGFASNLKEISVGEYCGLEGQFQLAAFILKNASHLRTFSVFSTSGENADSKLQMLKRLSSCPRGSVDCRLLFN